MRALNIVWWVGIYLNSVSVLGNGGSWVAALIQGQQPMYDDQVRAIVGLAMILLLLLMRSPNDRKVQ